MIKLIGTAYKRDDFTMKEFFDYWRDVHAPISAASGPLRGYIASEVIRKIENPLREEKDEEEVDGFVEQWWDDEETFDAAMATQQEEKAWADVLNYAKPTGSFWLVKDHVYIPPPITGPGSLTNEVWLSDR